MASLKEQSIDDKYPSDIFYFYCGELSPEFELFFPAITKKLFNDFEKILRSNLYHDDDEVRKKAICESLCVLAGTEKTFSKYRRNVEKLTTHAKNGDVEYKNFCNDVILHYAHMRVLFHKPIPLMEYSQMTKMINMMAERNNVNSN